MKIIMKFTTTVEIGEDDVKKMMEQLKIDDRKLIGEAISTSFVKEMTDDTEEGMTMTLNSVEVTE